MDPCDPRSESVHVLRSAAELAGAGFGWADKNAHAKRASRTGIRQSFYTAACGRGASSGGGRWQPGDLTVRPRPDSGGSRTSDYLRLHPSAGLYRALAFRRSPVDLCKHRVVGTILKGMADGVAIRPKPSVVS